LHLCDLTFRFTSSWQRESKKNILPLILYRSCHKNFRFL